MPRVRNVGNLVCDLERTECLSLVLNLDRPCVSEGEVLDRATLRWRQLTILDPDSDAAIRMAPWDPRRHLIMRLPKQIGYAFWMLTLTIPGDLEISYFWRGGRRVYIEISGLDCHLLRPSACTYLAKQLSRYYNGWNLWEPIEHGLPVQQG